MSIKPDATIFGVTGFFAVLTTLIFGTLPAWRAGTADPGDLLKPRRAGAARRRILGRAFIPLQVALSFALVSIATLLSQSLIRLETEQTGFDLDHVTIQTAPFHLLKLSVEARMELYHRMKNRLEQLGGINAASFTLLTPMTSFQLTRQLLCLVVDYPNVSGCFGESQVQIARLHVVESRSSCGRSQPRMMKMPHGTGRPDGTTSCWINTLDPRTKRTIPEREVIEECAVG